MRLLPIACAAALTAGVAQARPVTFPGGAMSMTEVNGDAVLTQVDYTLNRRVAAGVFAYRDDDRTATGIVGNYLLFRRNTEQSQANAYLMAGTGPSWERQRGS